MAATPCKPAVTVCSQSFKNVTLSRHNVTIGDHECPSSMPDHYRDIDTRCRP